MATKRDEGVRSVCLRNLLRMLRCSALDRLGCSYSSIYNPPDVSGI